MGCMDDGAGKHQGHESLSGMESICGVYTCRVSIEVGGLICVATLRGRKGERLS